MVNLQPSQLTELLNNKAQYITNARVLANDANRKVPLGTEAVAVTCHYGLQHKLAVLLEVMFAALKSFLVYFV